MLWILCQGQSELLNRPNWEASLSGWHQSCFFMLELGQTRAQVGLFKLAMRKIRRLNAWFWASTASLRPWYCLELLGLLQVLVQAAATFWAIPALERLCRGETFECCHVSLDLLDYNVRFGQLCFWSRLLGAWDRGLICRYPKTLLRDAAIAEVFLLLFTASGEHNDLFLLCNAAS